ncbi:hypothetical protein CEXT_546111, partial [Caerostris extrusa]
TSILILRYHSDLRHESCKPPQKANPAEIHRGRYGNKRLNKTHTNGKLLRRGAFRRCRT